MSDKDRKLEEWEQKFVEAVRKYLDGEKLTLTEERMVAYGYTAATPGQRMGSDLVNKVLVRRNK
jgi:hypothetical protein